MDVEHALHGAIGRQEMRLYHQPIVDLETGRLSGFEALIRWQRDGVIVPPVDFIPIAEETGIINEIGAWALREALRELRGWIDDGARAGHDHDLGQRLAAADRSIPSSPTSSATRSSRAACLPTCCGSR